MSEEKKTVVPEKRKTWADKTTESAKMANKLLKKYYAKAAAASEEGRPVAWVMNSSVVDGLLEPMGIASVFTENYATAAAANQGGLTMIETAEKEGYPDNICSYARTGIGHAILRNQCGFVNPEWPRGGMPDPDLLVGSSANCEPRYKWYQQIRRYHNVPFFCAETSMARIYAGVDPKEVEPYVVKAIAAEVRRGKEFFEKHTGRKLDMDRLMESVKQGERTCDWWWKCTELCKHVPCPMPVEDFIASVPLAIMYKEEPESEQFFRMQYEELQNRIANNLSVIPQEKYRLLWGWGLPIYSYLRIFNIMEEFGAVPVTMTAINCFRSYTDETFEKYTDPFERMALGKFRLTNHSIGRANALHVTQDVLDVIEFCRDFYCDGVVLNSTPSCRPRTIGQMAAIEMLRNTGIPVLVMENDMTDSRTVDEVKIRNDLEMFMEVVDAAKRRREGH